MCQDLLVNLGMTAIYSEGVVEFEGNIARLPLIQPQLISKRDDLPETSSNQEEIFCCHCVFI